MELELTEAFQEAEVANWAKSQFFTNISHELRKPLNCVIGSSEIVITEFYGPIENKKYTDYIKDIHMLGTHLLSVINVILDDTKIELGELDLEEEEFDLGHASSASHSMVSQRVVTENVSISWQIDKLIP